MRADSRIQPHAFDDLARVQPVDGRVAVQLVEVGHAHGEIGVGEQLDGLGLGGAGEQHRYVLFQGALLQQRGKHPGPFRLFAHDDARGIEVVMQRLAFAQELGREDEVVALHLGAHAFGVAHRHGGLDHHHRLRVDGQHIADHGLDRARIEIAGIRVVIGGGGDDDVIGACVGFALVQCGAQVEPLVRQIFFDLRIGNGGLVRVDQVDLGRNDIQGDDFIVLRQQHGIGQADVAGAGDCDFHGRDA